MEVRRKYYARAKYVAIQEQKQQQKQTQSKTKPPPPEQQQQQPLVEQKEKQQLLEEQQQKQLLEQQQTQRKCHQMQTETTNHPRLCDIQQQQQQQQQQKRQELKKEEAEKQQHQPFRNSNRFVNTHQQQHVEQLITQKNANASGRVCPSITLQKLQQRQENHDQQRWPAAIQATKSNALPIASQQQLRAADKWNFHSITLGAKAAGAAAVEAVAPALALRITKTKALTINSAYSYATRFTWLWLLALLSVAQFTPTPTKTITTRVASPNLLPNALFFGATFLLGQASYAQAAIVFPNPANDPARIPTTITTTTYQIETTTSEPPRLMRYNFPADIAELAEMNADGDALVQVQVKRINLLDDTSDNNDGGGAAATADVDGDDDDIAALAPSAELFEQEQPELEEGQEQEQEQEQAQEREQEQAQEQEEDQAQEQAQAKEQEQEQDIIVPEQEIFLGDVMNELSSQGEAEADEQQSQSQQAIESKPNENQEPLLIFYRQVQHPSAQREQQEGKHTNPNLAHHHQHFQHGEVEELDTNAMHKHVTKRSATTQLSSTTATPPKITTTTTTSATINHTASNFSNITGNGTAAGTNATVEVEEKCEPKVLDEVPPEPFFDFSDIAEDAARQFTDFVATKFGSAGPPAQQVITAELREELRRRANGIASYALNEDENLLAFAIAAPSIQTVVVKFRDDVTIPPDQVHSKTFLGSYWRELGVAWNSTEGTQEWGAPFRDCNLLKRRWLWPFRITFSENKIKIGAAAFIAADEDVCNDGLEEVFGRKHGCDHNTTFCLLTENKPAPTRDVYTCICRESFYLPNSTLQGFRGDIVEASEGFGNYSCIPCPDGCSTCDQHGVCLLGEPPEVVSMESLLNVSVGSVLGACMLCCIVLSVIVFRQRKCKAIASGMWTVLETILLGIILLYASVAVHFFPATTERCLIEPWLRELGFITCYGAIILKLYRHLVDFRTRKAHRWVLRDIDLLKYLGTMVFAVTCYMSAFTAAALDLIDVSQLGSLREQRTNTCLPLKWEYVTQVSEVLILCFGLHLAFASRNANTQFRERQFLVATLAIEFLVSTSFYVARFFYLPEMSPSAIFLALFLRSQLTNTLALGLIFVPKLWYQHKQVPLPMNLSIRLPVDAFKVNDPQRLGGGYAGLCLGDPDIGELTIAEMSPEDIRAELKRLYTQLEILKNKTLRQDNPHISKRRGGRKAGHRRFSLQALSAKHRSNKHHQDIEITEAEPSRTPEDSVCSVEGPTDAEISGISHSMLSHSAISHSVVSHSK